MGKNGGRQTLSKEMLEAIAEKAAEIAAAVATNTYQQKVKEEEKAKFDKRYKNTKISFLCCKIWQNWRES